MSEWRCWDEDRAALNLCLLPSLRGLPVSLRDQERQLEAT